VNIGKCRIVAPAVICRISVVEFLRVSKPRKLQVIDEPKVGSSLACNRSIRLRISTLSRDAIEKIIAEVDDACKELIRDKSVEDDRVAQLSDDQVRTVVYA
jgi:hypothetical protein